MPHVERAGVRLHYETFGSGAPLVLLHPLTTNRYFWAHQIFAFARTHRVVVLDLRGHGLSSRPAAGYGVGEMAADVRAVMDDAGVADAVLVGNSIGGMIALQTALDAPERVRALVVVSSGTNLAPSVPPAVFDAYRQRFDAAFDFMLKGSTSAKTKAERPEVCDFLGDVSRVADNFTPAVFLACMDDPDGVFHWNIAERLPAIQAPALVIAGAEDQAMPLEATRALATAMPHARFALAPDVAHYYPLESPEAFNAEVRAFLS